MDLNFIDTEEKRQGTNAYDLRLRHLHGISYGTNEKAVLFANHDHIIFPAGKQCVLLNLDNDQQEFLLHRKIQSRISCIATCASRSLVAICEDPVRGPSGTFARVTILQLNPQKNLFIVPEASKKSITACVFSNSGRLLATAGNAPNYCVSVWRIETKQLVLSKDIQTPVYSISFTPWDQSIICVAGKHYLKLLKRVRTDLETISLLPTQSEKHLYAIDHLWYGNDSLLVLDDSGTIYHFYKSKLEGTHTSAARTEHEVVDASRPLVDPAEPVPTVQETLYTTLGLWARGFIAGCADGTLSLYHSQSSKTDENQTLETFFLFKRFSTGIVAPVTCITTSPNSDIACIALERGHLLSFLLNKVESVINSDTLLFQDLFPWGQHSDKIVSMSISPIGKLVATASIDHSVRLWSVNNAQCRSASHFISSPFAVALHPTGFQIAISFKDHLDVYYVLMNRLKHATELAVREVSCIRYSYGGSRLAIGHNQSITVLDSLSLLPVAFFSDHQDTIISLRWSANDLLLASTSTNGSILTHDIAASMKQAEVLLKIHAQHDVVLDSEGNNLMLSAGADKHLRLFRSSNGELQRDIETTSLIHSLALDLSRNVLFAGTHDGLIQLFSWPIVTKSQILEPYTSFQAHDGPIIRLEVDEANGLLFSASQDGVLLCFLVSALSDEAQHHVRAMARPKVTQSGVRFSRYSGDDDVCLMCISEYDENHQKQVILHNNYQLIERETETKLNQSETRFKKRLEEIVEEYTALLKDKDGELASVRESTSHRDKEFKDSMADLERKQQATIDVLVTDFEEKMAFEDRKFSSQAKQMQACEKRFEEEKIDILGKHAQEVAQIRELHFSERKTMISRIAELEQELEEQRASYDEAMYQLEEEHESELSALHVKTDSELNEKNLVTSKAVSTMALAVSRHDSSQKARKGLQEALSFSEQEKNQLKQQHAAFQRELEFSKKYVLQREREISRQQLEISKLRNDILSKDSFKTILIKRIHELEEREEPAIKQIMDLNAKIDDMSKTIERLHLTDRRKENQYLIKSDQIHALSEQMDQLRRELVSKKQTISYFIRDIQGIVVNTPEDKWPDAIASLYLKHTGDDPNNPQAKVSNLPLRLASEQLKKGTMENERQRRYLESEIAKLRKEAEGQQEYFSRMREKFLVETTGLTEEISRLKKEKKELQLNLGEIESWKRNHIHGNFSHPPPPVTTPKKVKKNDASKLGIASKKLKMSSVAADASSQLKKLKSKSDVSPIEKKQEDQKKDL